MQSSEIERTLRAMIEAEEERVLAEQRGAPKGRLARLFARKMQKDELKPVDAARAAAAKTSAGKKTGSATAPKAGKAKPSTTTANRAKKSRRGDFIIAGLGLALGFGCAVFPWYIFFNQEKFGVRAMRFAGNGGQNQEPIYLGNQGERVGAPMTVDDIPPMKLDLFATGTPRRTDDGLPLPTVEDQPFPGDDPKFKVVYIANGRAMISDDSGLWVVQPGSLLPDNSTVARIEQRDGQWVLVTSTDQVVQLSAE